MDALQELVERQCGALAVSQALGCLTPAALRWRVASGRWQRPARGLLVAHSGPVPRETWLWLAVLAGGRDAVLAGPTAAALGGLRGYESDRVHLLVGPGRQVTALAGLVVHRSGRLPARDVHAQLVPRRTTLPRSIVDTASWRRRSGPPARSSRPPCSSGSSAPASSARCWTGCPPRRRRVILRTLDDVEGGSQSIAELDLVRLCRRAGLPVPTRQAARTDRAGRRRWLDAWWPQWRLQVEVDGAAHAEVGSWWADMSRQNEAWIRGERVLRFPAVVLRREPAVVVAQLRAALAAAGWPGSPPARRVPSRSAPPPAACELVS